MWERGIRNGEGGGRIVPLKRRIATQDQETPFRMLRLVCITEGGEAPSPYPFPSLTCSARNPLAVLARSRNVAR